MKRCPNCGKEIADDALFCSSCGKKVVNEPEAEPSSSSNDSSTNASEDKTSYKGCFKIILWAVLCFGIIMYFGINPSRIMNKIKDGWYSYTLESSLKQELNVPIRIDEETTLTDVRVENKTIYYVYRVEGITLARAESPTGETYSLLKEELIGNYLSLGSESEIKEGMRDLRDRNFTMVYRVEDVYGKELISIAVTPQEILNAAIGRTLDNQKSNPLQSNGNRKSSVADQRKEVQKNYSDNYEERRLQDLQSADADLEKTLKEGLNLPVRLDEITTLTNVYVKNMTIYYICQVEGLTPEMVVNLPVETYSEMKKELINNYLAMGSLTEIKEGLRELRDLNVKMTYRYVNLSGQELFSVAITPQEILDVALNQSTNKQKSNLFENRENSQSPVVNQGKNVQSYNSDNSEEETLRTIMSIEIKLTKVPIDLGNGLSVETVKLIDKQYIYVMKVENQQLHLLNSSSRINSFRTELAKGLKENQNRDTLLLMKKYGYCFVYLFVNQNYEQLHKIIIYPSELI